jgi:hypothetical protein
MDSGWSLPQPGSLPRQVLLSRSDDIRGEYLPLLY